MGTPLYPEDWALKFKALEDRCKALFTAAQSRVKYARIVADLLTVGEGNGRIEIVPGSPAVIRFNSDLGQEATISYATSPTESTVNIHASGGGEFETHGSLNIDGVLVGSSVSSDDGDVTAQVTAFLQESPKYATVMIYAVGQGAATAYETVVEIVASGGLVLPSLAANPAGANPSNSGVLYTVGTSLRWRDPTGTVHTIV